MRHITKIVIGLWGGGLALLGIAEMGQAGQTRSKTPYLQSVVAAVKPARVAPGGKTTLTVTVNVAPGFHINAHVPDDPFAIATEFSPSQSGKGGPVFGTALYPRPTLAKFAYSPQPQKIYQGAVSIQIPVSVPASTPPGLFHLAGTLHVQGCNATSCFQPTSLPVTAMLNVGR